MGISKFIKYYSVFYLVYRIIKTNLKKYKNFNKKNILSSNLQYNTTNNNDDIVMCENIISNDYNIKYDKDYSDCEDIDLNLENSNNDIDDSNKYQVVLYKKKIPKKNIFEEKIILKEINENLLFNNESNNLCYIFNSKPNSIYKIKCKLTFNQPISNINLIISNESKTKIFKYNYEKNCNIYEKIINFGFILENNEFTFDNDEKIYFYLFFPNNTLVNNFSLLIIEKNIIKTSEAILIFEINDNKYPLYPNTCNILDYIEYTDNNLLFFI